MNENLVGLLGDTLDDAVDMPAQVRFLLTSRPDSRLPSYFAKDSLDLVLDAQARD